jgi:hypothetical protein
MDSWEYCSGMPLLLICCHPFLFHLQCRAFTVVNRPSFWCGNNGCEWYPYCSGEYCF